MEMLEAVSVVPLNVRAVPEVMRVPSKKFTPLVTWVEVAVPPWLIPRIPKVLESAKVDVAETRPALFACRKPEPVPRVRAEVEALVNVLLPVKELLLARSVVEEMVMLVDPSKVTPLMVRPVWRVVAVFALPPMESDAAEPVSPVPAPVNEEPEIAPVAVKLPTTVEEELAMYPLVKVCNCAQEFAVVVPKPMEKLLPV